VRDSRMMTFIAAAMTKYAQPSEEDQRKAIEEIIIVPEDDEGYCLALNIGTQEDKDVILISFEGEEKKAYADLMTQWSRFCVIELIKVKRDGGREETEEDVSSGGEVGKRSRKVIVADNVCDFGMMEHLFYIAVEEVLVEMLAKVHPDMGRIPTFLVPEMKLLRQKIAKTGHLRAKYKLFVKRIRDPLVPIAKKFGTFLDKKRNEGLAPETPVRFVRFLVDASVLKVRDDSLETLHAFSGEGEESYLDRWDLDKKEGKSGEKKAGKS